MATSLRILGAERDRRVSRTAGSQHRSVRRRYLWAGGRLLATVLALLLTYREEDDYVCARCHSWQTIIQWRIGIWPTRSIPVSPQFIVNEYPSHLYRDLMGLGHKHEWCFRGGGPKNLLGMRFG